MTPVLDDLYGHQFWADSELWNAVGAHPPARDDKEIRDRLHHIHQVQRFFMWAVSGGPQPTISRPDDYYSFDDLKAYARGAHDEIRRFLDQLTEAQLASAISMPWFKDPPLTISIAEALTQCAMHSHHHRAQNLTRLRAVGGNPPMLDLIVWYWKGRPAPRL